MRAMILAAGLGTRLRPLTDSTPKALIKIKGKTLLEIAINNLVKNGFDKIIINIHHHAQQVIDYINQNKFDAQITISDETNKLLDTGGGLKQASWFFNDGESFIVYNADVLSNIDLQKLYSSHEDSESIATLAVRKRESSRYLLFNSENILCGWENVKTNEKKIIRNDERLQQFAFSGIQILSPEIFTSMPDKDVFSLIDLYLKIGSQNEIKAFVDDESFWLDVGKPENLKAAENINLIL